MTQAGLIPSESEHFLKAALDALSALIAILKESGMIVAVNESWRNVAATNGLRSSHDCIGLNYMAICDSTTGQGVSDAKKVAQGIRDVLTQQIPRFYFEYPCTSPTGTFFFALRVRVRFGSFVT